MAEPVRFQHFEVLRKEDGSLYELGRGAMGITYKAFDTNLRCDVALKVINAAYLNSEVARQRFLREARAAAALRHPNVATVFHLGQENDDYFYAMEFVDGETVEAFMKREGAVPAPLALEIAQQVCRALSAAERQGLVHRDIKPSNLMLVRHDGELIVKVIDFGLAKNAGGSGDEETATLTMGGFLGTPHFASPEQLEEKEIDIRSDIYSLGVTVWYMLAGRTPFGGSLAQVMSQHLYRQPPLENLQNQPPQIVSLLSHMMEKEPGKRPQTPAELRKEIEVCAAHLTPAEVFVPATPVTGDFETAVLPDSIEPSAVELTAGVVLGGRFKLLHELTASDHGRLFAAEGLEDGRKVMILIIHAQLLGSSEDFTKLEQDVDSFQKIKAPAIQVVLSLERANHVSFLVLEWVEGPSLLDLLRARRALSMAEALPILRPLAEAFDALAAASLACPDIAPHEIVLLEAQLNQPVNEWPRCQPKFLALAFAHEYSSSPEATMVASPFSLMKDRGAFAEDALAAYIFAVASLAYEVLGGLKGGSSSAAYVPLPGLSEAGNTALRQGLSAESSFATAQQFVEAISVDAVKTFPRAEPPRRLPVQEEPVPLPPPDPKAPVWPAIIASGLIILVGVGIWLSGIFSAPAPKPGTASAEPTPPPWATPTPTPGQALSPYEQAMAAAQKLPETDTGAALSAYAAVAQKFPEEKRPFEMMEQLAAKARSTADQTSPGQLAALRQPLEEAAVLNVRSAQMLLGETLFKSDPQAALKWFLAAANNEQTEGMVQAGLMLSNGEGTTSPDLVEAARWFGKAADWGDPEGMYLYAECLIFAKGVPKDPQRALTLLTSAAEFGNVQAMSMLGDLYKKGIPGVLPPDLSESFRLYSRAADKGLLDAQGNLGVLYINGQGVERDPAKAVELFKDGAERGNAFCAYSYAMCLQGGVGVTANPELAQSFYIRAAEGGNKAALDWCQDHGIAVTPANSPSSRFPKKNTKSSGGGKTLPIEIPKPSSDLQ